MNIKDLMTDDLGKVAEFEAACDDMINSRYILAESKIIKIMQTVALSTVLQRIIGDALNGFDYAAAAREWQNGGIKMPADEKDFVALVFCILADVDNRRIFLSDFLRKFFWNGDINSAYASFCASMITPFKTFVASAPSHVKRADSSVGSLLERKAMNLAAAIEKYEGFERQEKDEYIFMCDSIADKARTDVTGARALAIGLKRLMGSVPELAPLVDGIVVELGC